MGIVLDEFELHGRAAGELDVEHLALAGLDARSATMPPTMNTALKAMKIQALPIQSMFGLEQPGPTWERQRQAAQVLEVELVDQEAEDRSW